MKQLLVTLLVLAVAVAVIRLRKPGATSQGGGTEGKRRDLKSRYPGAALAGYGLVAVLVISAAVVFYFRWEESNRIVTVRVLDTRSGGSETYQVRKKNIEGRSFRTVDGRYVSLGDGDRMELIER
ncbi:MAG TPA: hypothetical protein VKA32_06595 [Gammaproteobacteria bacterium]|nr:hypothetical protein [Gammaproteobacteria bacterium]